MKSRKSKIAIDINIEPEFYVWLLRWTSSTTSLNTQYNEAIFIILGMEIFLKREF